MSTHECREFAEGSRRALAGGPEAWSAWIAERTDVENCTAALLCESYRDEDWDSFNLYVRVTAKHPSTSYTRTLCAALSRRIDEIHNEGVVDALAEIRDPASVDCLEQALWWEPDWDEFRGMAVKILWALAAIGTPKAVDVLRNTALTADERTRSFAADALKRFDH